MQANDLKLAQEIMAALKDVNLPQGISISIGVDYNGQQGLTINIYRI